MAALNSLVSYIVLAVSLLILCVYSASVNRRKTKCSEIPPDVLSEILGPAYNSRYMSIAEPEPLEMDPNDAASAKRELVSETSFYVDENYAHEISDEPAWKTNHVIRKKEIEDGKKKEKRSVKMVRQWECESKIRWQDLGPNYFPRYLRSVECTAPTCWYGMMSCRPRSFTVKLLRRKRDRCIEDTGFKIGSVGLPQDLRELWVWEERAINFCCDCAL